MNESLGLITDHTLGAEEVSTHMEAGGRQRKRWKGVKEEVGVGCGFHNRKRGG